MLVGRQLSWYLLGVLTGVVVASAVRKALEAHDDDEDVQELFDQVSDRLKKLESSVSS